MANLNTSSITALNDYVEATPLENFGTIGIIISNTWVGTLTFQGSLNGIDFVNILAQNITTNVLSQTTTANGQFIINVSGLKTVRVQMTSYTSGTSDITISANGAISFNRSLSTISGASDGTSIGNILDRLKVDAETTIVSIASGVNAFSQKLRYEDLNVANGGIARGSTVVANNTWVRLFSYTGNGVYTGMSLGLATANTGWYVRLVIDGTNEIFGSSGIFSTDVDNTYGLSVGTQNTTTYGLGFGTTASFLYHSSPTYNPLRFDSNIEIYVRRLTGAGNKVFNGGLIGLTEEV